MSGRRILSDAQIDEMAELREAGWSYRRIADHFTKAGTPINPSSLHWQCLRVGADVPMERRHQVTPRTEPFARGGHIVRPFTAEEDTLLRVLDMQGFKVSVMSHRLCRPSNSIRGRLMTLARHDARREDAEMAGAA